MLRTAILVSCVLCLASAQFGNDDSTLPIQLSPALQSQLNDTDADNIKKQSIEYFKKKCEDVGHTEIFDDAQNTFASFTSCLKSLVDVNVLQEEVEAAKPTGNVDEVFKKYCDKRDDFQQCFRNLTDTVQPCFTSDEQNSFETLHNVSAQLANFICFKDGERIALFIAEGGKECFEQQQMELQSCFNSTFDSETRDQLHNLTSEVVSSPFQLEFKEQQCAQMSKLQLCVVSTLQHCPAPTTANIVESLFKFIRKGTPCSQFKVLTETSSKPSNGNSLSLKMAVAIMSIAVFVLI